MRVRRGGDGVSEPLGAGRVRPGILATVREAVAGGAFGSRDRVPAGRAERLGLAETDPDARIAPTLPFAFLRLGDKRRFAAELTGRPDGVGTLVVEFTAGDETGANAEGTEGWTSYPYHVVALELGMELPWFAVAQRRVSQPSHKLYPQHRERSLETSDRAVNRAYALHGDDAPALFGTPLGASIRSWLPGALALRVNHGHPVALEVAGGWALTAIQAGGLTVPDAVALNQKQRLGMPGPWPDELLGVLKQLRAIVSQAR
jgi:hypothetical protein